uniref:Uncharacterized protein n=1 Tax=Anguilla anguilla TaxID=7936 RepID=A0A0E9W467_ANGAN
MDSVLWVYASRWIVGSLLAQLKMNKILRSVRFM